MPNIIINGATRLADIRSRLSADMATQLASDLVRKRLHLEAAITYAALGGHQSKELIDASTKGGARKNTTGWEGRWLMTGLTGTNWNSLPAEDKDARDDQLQALAGVIRASIYLAGGLIELAAMTVADLEQKFDGSFQKAVRKALSDEASGRKAQQGFSEADLIGEEELADQDEALLKEVRELGSIETLTKFRPSKSGQAFLLLGYRDEDGTHIARELSVSPSALRAMLPPPSLDGLDDTLNGVSEHLLLTKSLLPNRHSSLPEDADADVVTEATPRRTSGRATMLRGARLDTSLSHLTCPEMVVVTTLSEATSLPAGSHILHAPARSKFEVDVAPESARQHFSFAGVLRDTKLASLTFKRARSSKSAKIGLIPVADWGSDRLRNPHAHRLCDAYTDVGVRSIGGDVLSRLRSEVLDSRPARQAPQIEIRLKEGNVILKAGKASPLQYDAELDGGTTEEMRLTIPTTEFQAAMEAAIAGTIDGKVGISGDKRGVACVSWTGHGARHEVYIASASSDGARDAAGLFQRYDKTSD